MSDDDTLEQDTLGPRVGEVVVQRRVDGGALGEGAPGGIVERLRKCSAAKLESAPSHTVIRVTRAPPSASATPMAFLDQVVQQGLLVHGLRLPFPELGEHRLGHLTERGLRPPA